MPNEQTRALAQELVDFISGEPKRFEEEQAAVSKAAGRAATRKARLVDEVTKKIDALMPKEEAEEDSAAPAPAAPHKAATHK